MAQLKNNATTITALADGDALTLTVGEGGRVHWFVGVEFFTSLAGTVLATPTAGLLTFDVLSPALPGTWQRLDDTVNAATGGQISFDSPILAIRVNGLSTVTGGSATHCKMVAVAAES